MDVVVTSRNLEVSDRFRDHVEDKLSRLEKHDHRIIRLEVEVEKERNPRQQERAVRVELTAFSKGPVIRAEAAADDKMAALDLAMDKMAAQMRRAAGPQARAPRPPYPGVGEPGPGRRRRADATGAALERRRARTTERKVGVPDRDRVTVRSWCARRPTPPRR